MIVGFGRLGANRFISCVGNACGMWAYLAQRDTLPLRVWYQMLLSPVDSQIYGEEQ